MLEHEFTIVIFDILKKRFGEKAHDIYLRSPLLQYLNSETRAASKDSKSRKSNGNLFALYSLVLDYRNNGYYEKDGYSNEYKGARFTDLKKVANSLPGGDKLQNHAFNHRLNEKFKAQFQDCPYQPIIRNLETKRYYLNENLILVEYNNHSYNISEEVLLIIQNFIRVVKEEFDSFINYITELSSIGNEKTENIAHFILKQLSPTSDARIFEIVSFAILKYHYKNQYIIWGTNYENLEKDNLKLFKTGRTNANDGGIDFVMRPLGRFFQVTETLDFKKYFLDIDKIQRFPVSFVVKTLLTDQEMRNIIYNNALKSYNIPEIVKRYMDSIEDIINIQDLIDILNHQIYSGEIKDVLNEIVLQSRLEFNYDEED
ncbi:MAG: restriction endonuclease [Aliarcobacter butzleri]|nr:MAG: restriction endonuclease [Aliarcobacter butzleri]